MTGEKLPNSARVDPRALAATRVELHHVAVLVSGVGRTLARRQPGYLHASLRWDAELGGLAGWPVESPSRGLVRAALVFGPPRVLLLDSRDGPQRVWIDLIGSRFAEIQEQLSAALTDAGLHAVDFTVRIPADLPPGPIQTGEILAPDPAAARELGRWFAFADQCLAKVAVRHDSRLPVPCWPDHFDLAVAVRLGAAGAPARPDLPKDATVTMGFSPGDGGIPEPYFYVTAWPVPKGGFAALPPAPPGGRWQLDGWTGLVLTATAILEAGDRQGLAAAFVARGYEICRDLLGAASPTPAVP